MKPVKQKIFDSQKGDCMRACFASILEIPNDDKFLPNIDDSEWLWKLMKALEEYGMRLGTSHTAIWKQGYWIASAPSLNIAGGWHAVVMFDNCVAFDPSTHKRYRKGTNMLGKNVRSGYWIEVSDFSKLINFFK